MKILKRVLSTVLACNMFLIVVGCGSGDSSNGITREPVQALTFISEQVNERGNTTGNIINGGIATIQGDWFFYAGCIRRANGGGIYRINADGTGKLRISDEPSVAYLNIVGDWIYFTGNSGSIYRIRTDGTDREELIENKRDEFQAKLDVCVIGDWVYFRDIGIDYARIYRIRTDGSDLERLSEDNTRNLNVVDGWIYYSDKDSWDVYRMKTDGSDRERLVDISSDYLNVAGGLVYHGSNHGGIYRLWTDGMDNELIYEGSSRGINASNDWIYFYDWDNEINRMRNDGMYVELISSDESSRLNIVGDWIYYENHSDGGRLYRIRTDGTYRQRVD